MTKEVGKKFEKKIKQYEIKDFCFFFKYRQSYMNLKSCIID